MRRITAVLFVAALCLGFPGLCEAQDPNPPGGLDTSFGIGGTFTSPDIGRVYRVAVQTDGKLVVVGTAGGSTSQWGITRLNPDGTVDTTFAPSPNPTPGLLKLFGSSNDHATDVAINSDGIYVTGWRAPRFTLVRLTANGTLDTNFSGDGIAEVQIQNGSSSNGLELQPDGKIVVCGSSVKTRYSAWAVARFSNTGALDTQFGTGGYRVHVIDTKTNCEPREGAIALQADGKIVVGGWKGGGGGLVSPDYIITRYTANGAIDSTFGTSGVVTQTFNGIYVIQLWGLAVAGTGTNARIFASGKAVFTGGVGRAFVAKYNPNGSLDTSFSSDGVTYADPIQSTGGGLAIQADGKIVVAASAAAGICAFRFDDITGALDPSFDGDGMSAPSGTGGSAWTATVDAAGGILLGGYNTTGVVVRFFQ